MANKQWYGKIQSHSSAESKGVVWYKVLFESIDDKNKGDQVTFVYSENHESKLSPEETNSISLILADVSNQEYKSLTEVRKVYKKVDKTSNYEKNITVGNLQSVAELSGVKIEDAALFAKEHYQWSVEFKAEVNDLYPKKKAPDLGAKYGQAMKYAASSGLEISSVEFKDAVLKFISDSYELIESL